MPKTTNNLWQKINSWDNLHDSYIAARTGHRFKHEVMEFHADLEVNLTNIHNHLTYMTWEPGPYRQFWVYDPKSRLISAPPFCDRVVHHALVDIVEPLFERKMVHHSYACRKGKGIHSAVSNVQKQLRIAQRNWGRVYVLQADISKYFPSINHGVLLHEISRTIRDKDVLWLCTKIIRRSGYDGCGVPVGALTSQLFANVYLTALDHKIKDDWGIKHYTRYMDDFIIIGKSKQELWHLLAEIESYLTLKLRLRLNPKTAIYPVSSNMVDFAGYRICATHMLPRKRNTKRTRKAFKKMAKDYCNGKIGLDFIAPRVASFLGYTKHCQAFNTTESILSELALCKLKITHSNFCATNPNCFQHHLNNL